jgi:Putative Ig domain
MSFAANIVYVPTLSGPSRTPVSPPFQAFRWRTYFAQPNIQVQLAAAWGVWQMDPAYLGLPYDTEWYLENESLPIAFSLASGSLPPGLSLSAISDGGGKISGTPTAIGTYLFTLMAVNLNGSATQSFSITVNNFSAAPSAGFPSGITGLLVLRRK